jgi:ribosomal protein L32
VAVAVVMMMIMHPLTHCPREHVMSDDDAGDFTEVTHDKKKSIDGGDARGRAPPVCRFFKKGMCRNGDKCAFRHEVAHACPNEGCENLCFGRECSKCYGERLQMWAEQREAKILKDSKTVTEDGETVVNHKTIAIRTTKDNDATRAKRPNVNGSKKRKANKDTRAVAATSSSGMVMCSKCGIRETIGRICTECIHPEQD